jgi:hypothetical protein
VVWGFAAVTRRYDPEGAGWLPKDLNRGRLDLFFLCLAALMLFNLLLFLWVRLLSGGRAAGGSSRGGVQSGVEGFGVCRPGRSGGWMS